MLEIKRKNLNEEGSWGNLLEQLKLAHTNPAMREEIGRAQKQSLGFDYDFYEQPCLQFIVDEVTYVNLFYAWVEKIEECGGDWDWEIWE